MNYLKKGNIVILGVCICVIAFIVGGCSIIDNSGSAKKYIDADTIEDELQDSASWAKQTIITKGVINKETKGIPIITKKKYLLEYTATITTGVNKEKIIVKSDDEKVTIKLPHTKIQSITVPEKTIRLYNNSVTLFRADKDLIKKAIKVAQKDARHEAIQSGLLKETDKNAKRLFYGLASEFADGRIINISFID